MLDMDLAKQSYGRYQELFSSPVIGGGLSSINAAIWSLFLEFQRSRGILGNMIEIGVWQGHASALMCSHMNENERLLLVDRYASPENFMASLEIARENIEPQIVFEKACSIAARKKGVFEFYASSVRWGHIDGEHSFEAVYSDLSFISDLIKDGGIIAIDDIFSFESPNCTEALYVWTSHHSDRAVWFLGGFNKAYLCSPRDLPIYTRFAYELPDLLERLGHFVALTRSGWGGERACLGMIPRNGNNKFVRIGQAMEAASMEEFWFGGA